MMIQRVTFIGAGNLATQLGKAFRQTGVEIVQVYSRTPESAGMLGTILKTAFTTKTEEIDLSADLVVVAVADDAIEQVLGKLDIRRNLVVHTAGSVSLDVLKKYSDRCGVFYPLQTFSRLREVDFSDIPICLEGCSAAIVTELKELAGRITKSVYEIDSAGRRTLHLAAVFACNFVNHLYYVSDRLLGEQGLPFDLLKPLIRETASKIMDMGPYDAQTGPARRNDEVAMASHLQLLKDQPDRSETYRLLTTRIVQAYKNKVNDIV